MQANVRPALDFFADTYGSPFGRITLRFHAAGLSGLWFDTMQVPPPVAQALSRPACMPVSLCPDAVRRTREWLDCYFSRRFPDFVPPLHLVGSPFQLRVWEALLRVPCGETVTYGAVAQSLASGAGKPAVSARAVGGAVGRNPVSLIVPCHRVVGAGGRLTGYAGGLPLKSALLDWERGL